MSQSMLFLSGTETAEELLQRASSSGAAVQNGSTPPAPGIDVGKKPAPFDGRAFRRSLGKTGKYQRQPVHDAASLALMEEHGVGYRSASINPYSPHKNFPGIPLVTMTPIRGPLSSGYKL